MPFLPIISSITNRRLILWLLILVVITLLCYHSLGSIGFQASSLIGTSHASYYCSKYPDLGNIAIIVKTGATEAGEKLTTLLRTSLRCVQQPIIVSDLEQYIDGYHLHDVLANFPNSEASENPDFKLYWEQRRLAQEGLFDEIPRLRTLKDEKNDKKSAAWALDKYKNLPALELAWREQPNRDFYVFIDADTYLIWSNLLKWIASGALGRPDERSYWGRPFLMQEHKEHPIWFAHGGSGYILSGAAVRAFNEEASGAAQRWAHRIKDLLYGDFTVADALDEELNLQMGDGRPMVNNVNPNDLAFLPDSWCLPIVTVHHIGPDEAKTMLKLEEQYHNAPILYRDLYKALYPKGLPIRRENWQNSADDRDTAIDVILNNQTAKGIRRQMFTTDPGMVDPHKSYEACALACAINHACVQFAFWEWRGEVSGSRDLPEHSERSNRPVLTTKCHLNRGVRLGQTQVLDPQRDETWTSGWLTDRIDARFNSQEHCR